MKFALQRHSKLLVDEAGRVFDLSQRVWTKERAEGPADEISQTDAVKWLQLKSGAPHRVPVASIGTRTPTDRQREAAYELGAAIAARGLVLLCGGRGGIMEAASRASSEHGGISLGLLPDDEPAAANPYVSIPIATGIGLARNVIIA